MVSFGATLALAHKLNGEVERWIESGVIKSEIAFEGGDAPSTS